MNEERLYYTDSYLVEFDAVVRDVAPKEGHWEVTLDRTAFYPTSGGQPCDAGTLGEATVLDVFDREDGTIGHLVDRDLAKNARVRGHIAWDRRFDHMQQHSGQHLLSAAFDREAGARTVSFHLGASSATIDLDKEVAAGQIAAAESAANRIVWEDREVSMRFVTSAEAAKLPLRKDPARTGDLRIIEIEDYDLSACGGTHVSRTGAIGIIAIAGAERFKGGMRIEFVCGGRALRAFHVLNDAVTGGVRLLSVLPEELPAAIEKMQTASRAQQKDRERLQERLAAHEAAALGAKGQSVGHVMLVSEAVSGWDANGLKKLASTIAADPGKVAVLISAETPALVVVARSQDVAIDAGAILRKLIERFGGKGGGKGGMAQGGGLAGSAPEILALARDAVRSS
ncbi:MAG TPA: DHHA1 domain-containing protein [Vicinamibacterales bacterium]|nr:DHHA1 domain-containing protein [Vicinamibacterales bacterium]